MNPRVPKAFRSKKNQKNYFDYLREDMERKIGKKLANAYVVGEITKSLDETVSFKRWRRHMKDQ